jgi:hypothetical protein
MFRPERISFRFKVGLFLLFGAEVDPESGAIQSADDDKTYRRKADSS